MTFFASLIDIIIGWSLLLLGLMMIILAYAGISDPRLRTPWMPVIGSICILIGVQFL